MKMWFIKFTLFCVLTVTALEIGGEGGSQSDVQTSIKKLWCNFSRSRFREAAKIFYNLSSTKGEIRKKLNELIDKWGDEKLKVINCFS